MHGRAMNENRLYLDDAERPRQILSQAPMSTPAGLLFLSYLVQFSLRILRKEDALVRLLYSLEFDGFSKDRKIEDKNVERECNALIA